MAFAAPFAAPSDHAAAANGINAMARNVGNALGSAVVGLIAGAHAP